MRAQNSLPSERRAFEIRKAAPADLPALMRLEADRFASDRLNRRSFAALARSASADVLVAAHARGLVGYAVLLTRRGGRSARLYSIAVAAEEAGRGIGTALLQAIEGAARRRGFPQLRLEVRAENSTAIGLYERAGYRPIGRRSGYYADGTAALLYARTLSPPLSRSSLPRRLKRAA